MIIMAYKTDERSYSIPLTNGAVRYSIPMLREDREVFKMSFIKLYRSTRKLSVGPAGSRIMRSEGATSVTVRASKCVTPSVGAIVK
jgi:hypothetical protein